MTRLRWCFLLFFCFAGAASAQDAPLLDSLTPRADAPTNEATEAKPVIAPAAQPTRGEETTSDVVVAANMRDKLKELPDGCVFVERTVREKRKRKRRNWCQATGGGATVCMELDAFGKSRVVNVLGVRRGSVKAGAPVHLVVRAPTGGRVALVVCDGDKEADLGARTGAKATRGGDAKRGGDSSFGLGEPEHIVTATFYPRNAGTLVTQAVLSTPSGAVLDSTGQSLEAESTYSSAVYVGMSIMLGAAVDLEYKGVKVPGSRQSEIVATKATPVDVDLTLGFTPFIGGQRADGCFGTECIAPYFGIGLYSPKTKEVLKSVLLGFNYQITKSLSLSGVGVLRRVSVLSKGYHVGMAVDDNTSFTTKTWKLGWGIVMNLSPDILKTGLDAYRDKDLQPIFEREEE